MDHVAVRSLSGVTSGKGHKDSPAIASELSIANGHLIALVIELEWNIYYKN